MPTNSGPKPASVAERAASRARAAQPQRHAQPDERQRERLDLELLPTRAPEPSGCQRMQQAFADLSGELGLPQGQGPLAVLAQLAAGALITVLMQSPSASIAIALTAAHTSP